MDLHRYNVLILQQIGVNHHTQDEQLTLLVMMRRRGIEGIEDLDGCVLGCMPKEDFCMAIVTAG